MFVTALGLGSLAGVTILLGLPVGRLRAANPTWKLVLTATAVGILIFLVWDVLTHAWEPIDAALTTKSEGAATVAVDGTVFVIGLAVGLVGLALLERRIRRARSTDLPPRHLALLIATGIGVHNFAEGLAIGQSAAAGAVSLAVVLVIGFALHNATEGFGIVAPLAGSDDCPSWRFLLLLGAIGGGPTIVGAALGAAIVSDLLSILFLTVAAGSIIYVVIQLLGGAARARRPDAVASGILAGVIAGFATDAILTAAGA